MGAFLWIVFALFVGGFALLISVANADAESRKRDAAEHAAKKAAFGIAKNEFIELKLSGVRPSPVKIDGLPALLSHVDGQSGVRIIMLRAPLVFEITSDVVIQFSAIRAVEFVQDDVVETYMRRVTTPVAVQKKKSAIGRGLVGGVLLGPAGLLLGAASGVAPSTKIVEHTVSHADQRIIKGPPTMMLTTRERVDPFIRIEFAKPDDARAWTLWIGDQLAS